MVYVDSRGREHDPVTMPFPHLKNAVSKLERQGDPRDADLLAHLQQVMAERTAAYEAEQAAAGGAQ